MSIPNESGLPLAGLRVVDWTHVLAGPFAGYQLALLGADVVRIEQPGEHDMIRKGAADPALGAMGLGETFVAQSGNKRSLAVDAKTDGGKRVMASLIAGADVLLENFRPGKLATLGFDPARLIGQFPSLTVCSITGFGQASDRRAYDHVVQAASGLMAANGDTDGTPRRIGFPIVDYATGQLAATAVLAALYRRAARRLAGDEPPTGEWLQVSMMGAALNLLAPTFAEMLVSGVQRPRSPSTAFSGSALSGTFATRDAWVAITCNADNQAAALASALHEAGVPDGTLDALRDAAASKNVAAARALLAALLRERTAAEWEALFAYWGVPATQVRTPAEAALEASAQWPRMALPATPQRAAGSVPVPGAGFVSSQPVTHEVLRTSPSKGQDTRDILGELGFAPADIEALLAQGAVATA